MGAGNCLHPRVEGRVFELFQRAFVEIGYQAPAHRHELAATVAVEAHDVNQRRRRNVVAWLQIERRAQNGGSR